MQRALRKQPAALVQAFEAHTATNAKHNAAYSILSILCPLPTFSCSESAVHSLYAAYLFCS